MVNSAILLYSANKLADHIYSIKKGGAYNSSIIWFFVKSFISDLNRCSKANIVIIFWPCYKAKILGR